MHPPPRSQRGLSRRKFLIAAGIAAGAAAVPLYHFKFRTTTAGTDLGPRHRPKLDTWEDLYRQRWTWDRIAKGSHGWANCRSACAWDLYVKDGVVVREEQSATYESSEPGVVPDFNPRGCQKGACYTEVMYGPSRTTVPMKRVGPRGSGEWQKISWDQALAEIAEKMVDAASKYGTDTIYTDLGPNFDFGPTTMGRFRFQAMAGGLFADNWAEIGDLNIGSTMTLGCAHVGGSSDEWFLSDFLVVWMMNPSVTQIPDAHYLFEARYKGSELVVIDPIYSATAIHADQWLPIAPGTDAVLGMTVARHLLEKDAIDHDFLREQSDLPLLVRLDTGRFLREEDLESNGRNDQLYHWHPENNRPAAIPGCSGSKIRKLSIDYAPPLEGVWKIELADGQQVGVTTVGSLLKEHLEPWTFEHAAQVTGLAVEAIERFATGWEKAERPMVLSSWGSNRYVHSDLMNRSKLLCLALKGALGRRGAGYQACGWVGLDHGRAMMAEHSGIRGRLDVLLSVMTPGELFNTALDVARGRKTEYEAIAEGEHKHETEVICGTNVTSINYKHQGIREVLAKETDHRYPRPLEAYYQESVQKGWDPNYPRNGPPRVYLSGGANLLRRNNLPQHLMANMFDEMDVIVDINPKYTFSGMHSDYILPAAGWYEKTGIKYTVAYVPYLHFCDAAVPPLAESKDEFEIYWLLSREMERIAKERDLAPIASCGKRTNDYKTLHQRFTANGTFGAKDAEKFCDLSLSDSDAVKGATVEALKQTGITKYTSIGQGGGGVVNIFNPDWKGQGVLGTLTAFTEHKQPWPTFSGRITTFIDHPWFMEVGEQFATHKDSPKAGGDYPFKFVSCHARWSIHSTWRDSPMMLRLQRGEPLVYINPQDGEKLGIEDHDWAEIYNDLGSVRMRTKYSTAVRPGVAYYYHAWEPHQFPNHESYKWLIPGLINPLHFAGGYRHLNHGTSKYQPGTAVQDTCLGIRPWTGQDVRAKPVVRA